MPVEGIGDERPPSGWTGESIIAALRAWQRRHGAPPRSSDWQRHPGRRGGHGEDEWPSYSTVVRIFGGWPEALEAAGLAPAPRPARTQWPEERIERELRAFVAGRGELPRYRDFAAAGKRGLSRSAAADGRRRALGQAARPLAGLKAVALVEGADCARAGASCAIARRSRPGTSSEQPGAHHCTARCSATAA